MKKKNHKLGASLLSLDLINLKEELQKLVMCGIDFFHIDIMDGNFVPNLSFSSKFLECIRRLAPEIPFDIHFMVTKKAFFNIIKQFIPFRPEYIIIHTETIDDLGSIKEMLKNENIKLGIALNPETPVETIENLIPCMDLVLLMSVKPSFGGQNFLYSTFEKIDELLAMGDSFSLEVDGGIDLEISLKLKEKGVDLIVVGTNLVNSNDPFNFVRKFKSLES